MKRFTLRRNIWVFPSGDFAPYAPIPPYGLVYWPVSEEQEINVGDYVVLWHDSSCDPICTFMVESFLYRHEFVNEEYQFCRPFPDSDLELHVKLKPLFLSDCKETDILKDIVLRYLPSCPREATLVEPNPYNHLLL